MHYSDYATSIMVPSFALIRPHTLEFAHRAALDAPLTYPRDTPYLVYCSINFNAGTKYIHLNKCSILILSI